MWDYSDPTQELYEKYRKRIEKKKAGQPPPVQIIMDRTFFSAIAVASMVSDIEWKQFTFDMYYFCKDIAFQQFTRAFDSQLELAVLDQEKFVMGLHRFYNDTARQLRKEGKLYEFGQFIGAVLRMRLEKRETANAQIVDAYVSLVLQMLEYIRKNKFDLSQYPYGVSTDGEVLVGPYPLAYSDLPIQELSQLISAGKVPSDPIERFRQVQQLYAKYGIEIDRYEDVDRLGQVQRIHCNTAAAMFPLINEYTFDMAVTDPYSSSIAPFQAMSHPADGLDELKDRLQHRARTLPSNGVRFEIADPTGELQGVFMKEALYNDCVHMLYRADTDKGILAGYYDTKSRFLYSIISDASSPRPYENITWLLLSLYATQVLPDVSLDTVAQQICQVGQPLAIQAFGRGGKPQDTYHPAQQEGTRCRDLDQYDREERQVSIFIRDLPKGQQASEEAKALAARYGYVLGPGQTIVRPFTKQVFVRKKQPENKDDCSQDLP